MSCCVCFFYSYVYLSMFSLHFCYPLGKSLYYIVTLFTTNGSFIYGIIIKIGFFGALSKPAHNSHMPPLSTVAVLFIYFFYSHFSLFLLMFFYGCVLLLLIRRLISHLYIQSDSRAFYGSFTHFTIHYTISLLWFFFFNQL